MIKRILINIIIAVAFAGCEKEDVNLAYEPSPVVEAYLHAGQSIRVKVMQEIPFIEDDYDSVSVEDLDILISTGETSFYLEHDENGVYRAVESPMPEPNEIYNIAFLFNGDSIMAETIIPEKPTGFEASETEIVIDNSNPMGGGLATTIELYWDNPYNKYHMVMVENIESDPEPINEDATDEARKSQNQPTQNEGDNLRPNNFNYYGTHRLVLFRVNPEYAALYDSDGSSSQNIQNPVTNIVNGFGIFTGVNSDTLYIEVKPS